MKQGQIRFDALDSWRGIAALLVALFHFQAAGFFYDFPLIRNGNLAVPFFFVLSGFVITHAYRTSLVRGSDGWRFVIRRFGRLYPLHIFTLGIFVLLELAKLFMAARAGLHSSEGAFAGTNDIPSLIANVFLLQAVIPFPELTWNASSWSISTEFYTYLVFVAVFLGLGRYRMWGSVAVFIAAGVLLVWLDTYHPDLNLASGLGLVQCIFGFFAGNLTYELYLKLRENSAVRGTVPELLATAIMLLLFWFKPHYTTFNILGFSAAILLFSYEGGTVAKLLRVRPLLFLGKLSYSIYLVHFIVFAVIFAGAKVIEGKIGMTLIKADGVHERLAFGPAGLMDLMALGYLVSIIICACFTYYFVEEPGRKFFNRLSNRMTGVRAPIGQGANAR
ncbi:acyltransferase family protein [Rhizobiales bacterium RZME27]|uniref:Acyltransferase family protein n=1 Tax=Endobacterium cereale TaxID=2663029 RepID=A0A6A8ACA0_9HYPH|nr:acyltransferase [Endobacterium cereale]MEB2845438.1 acyltransferase [Endobacterium cereale]MQY48933.1 acyltransferase family protein [Endobacterium cereale]